MYEQLLKKCPNCDGKGWLKEIVDDKLSTSGPYETTHSCWQCFGQGKVLIDYFINRDSPA